MFWNFDDEADISCPNKEKYDDDDFTFSLTDLQNVNITLRILFRPLADKLPQIYTNLGSDYDERVLPSIVNEVLKAVVVSVQLSVVNFKHINVFCHLYYHSYLMT